MSADKHSTSSLPPSRDQKQLVHATSEKLTPSEVQSLKQHKHEMSDYLRNAFSHLRKPEKAE